MGTAMALPSFSCLIRCNAILMLACALMLVLHLLLRPHQPTQDLLLHSHNIQGSAKTWSTAGSGIKLPTSKLLARPDVVVLPNGVLMPRLGFGTAGLGEVTEGATSWALQAGYRVAG